MNVYTVLEQDPLRVNVLPPRSVLFGTFIVMATVP